MKTETREVIKKVGLGAIVIGGILAAIGGATSGEITAGGAIAFGVFEAVAAAITYIFSK